MGEFLFLGLEWGGGREQGEVPVVLSGPCRVRLGEERVLLAWEF